MSTTFLLIRHGMCDSVGHVLNGQRPGVHLNERGQNQAERIRELLNQVKVDGVYSSPLERTQETATPLARERGLPIFTHSAFVEADFGDWTGLTFETLDPLPEWRLFNAYRSGTRIPGGESYLELQNRLQNGLQELKRDYPGKILAVFTHCDIVRLAVVHALGMSIDLLLRIDIDPGSITAIRLEDWGPQLLFSNWTGDLSL